MNSAVTHTLGLSDQHRGVLGRAFADDQIQVDHSRAGFSPRYINWTHVVQRLDEAFAGGWSFEIVKWESWPSQVVVHGRLTVRAVSMIDGVSHVHTITKDGVGSAMWTLDPAGQYVDMSWDLKAAASDALKRAAVLMGVGLHLYDKVTTGDQARQDVEASQRANLGEPAQPFQVNAVIELFEQRFHLPRMQWMAWLQVRDPGGLTQQQATEILSGTHPMVQEMFRRGSQ